jgi:hypothetical protein
MKGCPFCRRDSLGQQWSSRPTLAHGFAALLFFGIHLSFPALHSDLAGGRKTITPAVRVAKAHCVADETSRLKTKNRRSRKGRTGVSISRRWAAAADAEPRSPIMPTCGRTPRTDRHPPHKSIRPVQGYKVNRPGMNRDARSSTGRTAAHPTLEFIDGTRRRLQSMYEMHFSSRYHYFGMPDLTLACGEFISECKMPPGSLSATRGHSRHHQPRAKGDCDSVYLLTGTGHGSRNASSVQEFWATWLQGAGSRQRSRPSASTGGGRRARRAVAVQTCDLSDDQNHGNRVPIGEPRRPEA